MSRILTGIQSSGYLHLGNILGAILPSIELSQNSNNDSFLFIADLHSFTSLKDPLLIANLPLHISAVWISMGLNVDDCIFYRQSRVPQVCELTWYLSCHVPYPMLANAHSFKDKSKNLADVNAGLFTYPVLMAADILMYDAEFIPVGKDQKQHLEICRDIATAFNNKHGEIFILPEPLIDEKKMVIPGIDGRKMSKSYHNTINIFSKKDDLKKTILSIVTDSKPLEEPKDPDECNVFKIYSQIASDDQIEDMRIKYLKGGYGYGHAKTELLDLILDKYKNQRVEYNKLIEEAPYLEAQLIKGEEKARQAADIKLNAVKKLLGYK